MVLTGNPDNMEPINEIIMCSNVHVDYYLKSYLPDVLENSFVYQYAEAFEQKLPVVGVMCLGVVDYPSVTCSAEMLPAL